MAQQNPIVVEVIEQPAATPEISYGSVLVSAVNLIGVILGAALLLGAIVGGLIIWRKKRNERKDTSAGEPTHVRLRIH
jgi:uncharacterized Tic20 family protein